SHRSAIVTTASVSPREVVAQVLANLRANRLRSTLTMFGIFWGVVSIVVLAAMGEGFRRGNEHVLRELGANIAIVWRARTGIQAGGEPAGRPILLTGAEARAIERDSPMVAVVSAELNRGASVKSAYNAAAIGVDGIEPQYQGIRTIEVDQGRLLSYADTAEA